MYQEMKTGVLFLLGESLLLQQKLIVRRYSFDSFHISQETCLIQEKGLSCSTRNNLLTGEFLQEWMPIHFPATPLFPARRNWCSKGLPNTRVTLVWRVCVVYQWLNWFPLFSSCTYHFKESGMSHWRWGSYPILCCSHRCASLNQFMQQGMGGGGSHFQLHMPVYLHI